MPTMDDNKEDNKTPDLNMILGQVSASDHLKSWISLTDQINNTKPSSNNTIYLAKLYLLRSRVCSLIADTNVEMDESASEDGNMISPLESMQTALHDVENSVRMVATLENLFHLGQMQSKFGVMMANKMANKNHLSDDNWVNTIETSKKHFLAAEAAFTRVKHMLINLSDETSSSSSFPPWIGLDALNHEMSLTRLYYLRLTGKSEDLCLKAAIQFDSIEEAAAALRDGQVTKLSVIDYDWEGEEGDIDVEERELLMQSEQNLIDLIDEDEKYDEVNCYDTKNNWMSLQDNEKANQTRSSAITSSSKVFQTNYHQTQSQLSVRGLGFSCGSSVLKKASQEASATVGHDGQQKDYLMSENFKPKSLSLYPTSLSSNYSIPASNSSPTKLNAIPAIGEERSRYNTSLALNYVSPAFPPGFNGILTQPLPVGQTHFISLENLLQGQASQSSIVNHKLQLNEKSNINWHHNDNLPNATESTPISLNNQHAYPPAQNFWTSDRKLTLADYHYDDDDDDEDEDDESYNVTIEDQSRIKRSFFDNFSCDLSKDTHDTRKPTNIFSLTGIYVNHILTIDDLSTEKFHKEFSKFGTIVALDRSKRAGDYCYVHYNNVDSPVKAIAMFKGKYTPWLTERDRYLVMRFSPSLEKMKEYHSMSIEDYSALVREHGECPDWRLGSCPAKDDCHLKHIRINRGVDMKPKVLRLNNLQGVNMRRKMSQVKADALCREVENANSFQFGSMTSAIENRKCQSGASNRNRDNDENNASRSRSRSRNHSRPNSSQEEDHFSISGLDSFNDIHSNVHQHKYQSIPAIDLSSDMKCSRFIDQQTEEAILRELKALPLISSSSTSTSTSANQQHIESERMSPIANDSQLITDEYLREYLQQEADYLKQLEANKRKQGNAATDQGENEENEWNNEESDENGGFQTVTRRRRGTSTSLSTFQELTDESGHLVEANEPQGRFSLELMSDVNAGSGNNCSSSRRRHDTMNSVNSQMSNKSIGSNDGNGKLISKKSKKNGNAGDTVSNSYSSITKKSPTELPAALKPTNLFKLNGI